MGLFGQNPSDQGVADQAAYDQQAMEMAKLTNSQRAQYAMASGGLQAGRGLKGILGIKDPALLEMNEGKAMMQGVDLNDPEALKTLAKAYAAKGMHRFGEEAYKKAVTLEKTLAETATAKTASSKAAFSLAQEESLRKELTALGPNATEEQYLDVVRKYGKPDEVMKSIETRLQKEAALEEKKRAADERFRLERERIAQTAATEAEKARMLAESRRQHDATLLAIAGMRSSDSKEKPLTAGQQLKLTKDTATSKSALRDHDNTLQNTLDLADSIVNHPGFAAAQGASTYLPSVRGGKTAQAEALIEEFKAQTKKAGLDLVRKGGSIGSMTEKEWPIVEAMVANIDPKASNVKEQMDKVIAKIEQIRANAYQTHNELYTDTLEPVKKVPKSAKPASPKAPMDADAWNKAWAALPNGSSMQGLDGKTYTKK